LIGECERGLRAGGGAGRSTVDGSVETGG
jgi:hypothetical protein